MVEQNLKDTKFCVNCGAEIDTKTEICPKCGVRQPVICSTEQQLEDAKFCVNCGARIDTKAEICPKCGVRQPSISSGTGRNRIVAALFAFFLGGLGIHKFYLGEVGWGIVYLLFCWTLIPAVIAFIEGIIYLTMSDEGFALMYDQKSELSSNVSSSNISSSNVSALLAYLFGWVTGLIFYLIEKEDKYVRFHAMQSILFSVGCTVICVFFATISSMLSIFEMEALSSFMGLIASLFWFTFIIVSIFLMVKAYQGEKWKLPIIGDMAERYA